MEVGHVPTSGAKVEAGEVVAEVPEVGPAGSGPLKGDQLPGAGARVAVDEVGVPAAVAPPPVSLPALLLQSEGAVPRGEV